MAKKSSALAGIFDDEPEAAPPPAPQAATEARPTPAAAPAPAPARPAGGAAPAPRQRGRGGQGARSDPGDAPARRSSHPGKKPVLIHIPEDMHRTLRQLSVEEGGEPLTVITERLLREYLVKRGHTRFAP